jgi:hypothetical protein
MRKVLLVVVVAVALALPATPAFAIHHGRLGFVIDCSQGTQALGLPATGLAQTAHSNTVLGMHNHASPPCHFAVPD